MKNSEFFSHIHDQLSHIERNTMTHAQKTGAIMLIQFEIEKRKYEVEHEIYEATLKFKVEYLKEVLFVLDRVQRDIAKNSPLQHFINEQKELLRRKAPPGFPYDSEEIPF